MLERTPTYTSLSEHAGSYYAATAHEAPPFPALEGSTRVDVCVVGGGFTGLSTAITLAERGYRVALVEAERVGWGASGRNGGQLIGGISGEARLRRRLGAPFERLLWDMRWAGHDIIRRRIEQYRIDCDLKWGYLDVALKPRHMKAFEADRDALAAHAFPHEFRLVSAEEVEALIGTRTYIGGLLNMGNGHLHPLNLCLGEARAAASLGVAIYERSPVTHIEHGSRPRAHTARGSVDAEVVVLAGNAYHRLEAKHLGGVVFPAGSFIMATEPLSEPLISKINPSDLAVCDPNHVLDYFRLSADKRLLFGGRCNYSGRWPKSVKAALLPRLLKIYPQLEGSRIEYEWGGKIGITVNRVPRIGRIGKNVFYAQGYSGHGVNVTHLAGEILADAIAGTFERFDVFARVEPIRIPGGQWFGNHLVALGMIYYRLRDML